MDVRSILQALQGNPNLDPGMQMTLQRLLMSQGQAAEPPPDAPMPPGNMPHMPGPSMPQAMPPQAMPDQIGAIPAGQPPQQMPPPTAGMQLAPDALALQKPAAPPMPVNPAKIAPKLTAALVQVRKKQMAAAKKKPSESDLLNMQEVARIKARRQAALGNGSMFQGIY